MKVKVTKASRSSYWYADNIGEIFEVKEDASSLYGSTDWVVVEPDGSTEHRYIDKKDCEEVVTMKAKVLKAGKDSYWYADRIGEVFEIKQNANHPDKWTVLGDPDGDGFNDFCCLDKTDVEVISSIPVPGAIVANKYFAIDSGYSIRIRNMDAYKAAAEKNPLELSIKKWDLICQGIYLTGKRINEGGTTTCGLCYRYYYPNCKECPVQQKTGYVACSNSPYTEYGDGRRRDPSNESGLALLEAAKELFFLKSLRARND